jgi:hypothetical protein
VEPSSIQASTAAGTATPTAGWLAGAPGADAPLTGLSQYATPQSSLPGWLQDAAEGNPTPVLRAAFGPGPTAEEERMFAEEATPPRPRPQRFAAPPPAAHAAVPGSKYRAPLADSITPQYHTALHGDYSLKSLSQAAASASAGRRAGHHGGGGGGGSPSFSASSGAGSAIMLRDNPLAGLAATPEKENAA